MPQWNVCRACLKEVDGNTSIFDLVEIFTKTSDHCSVETFSDDRITRRISDVITQCAPNVLVKFLLQSTDKYKVS